jgi:hypothetical protein
MYVWIWRRLPGNWAAKAVASLLLAAAVVALLFFFVFPPVERWLPYNNLTVDPTRSHTPGPVATSTP